VNVDPQSLTRKIIEEQVPPHSMVPKVTPYSGTSDPEANLKAFAAQMLISGGSDTIRCKISGGTLTEMALQ